MASSSDVPRLDGGVVASLDAPTNRLASESRSTTLEVVEEVRDNGERRRWLQEPLVLQHQELAARRRHGEIDIPGMFGKAPANSSLGRPAEKAGVSVTSTAYISVPNL